MLDLSALFRSQVTRAFIAHSCTIKSRRVPPTQLDYRDVCAAKTSSSRLAGRKSWGIKLLIISCFGQAPVGANALHLHWQQILVADSHVPRSRSSTIPNTYIHSNTQELTPASPVHLACGVVDARIKACMPLRQSQIICLGGSNLALRLCDDPPILQLPQEDPRLLKGPRIGSPFNLLDGQTCISECRSASKHDRTHLSTLRKILTSTPRHTWL
ncbi:hypothetical protein EDB82DRAFT_275933 [Fusarium venenatum]|uniref:uncharacterized protein n=1 Tax=Fusarium venenatum TaxID=56646 RepID=UPI001DF21038|nr:hypothetical protein EDB82DRAFT_275933 [Fusarium venenatum]